MGCLATPQGCRDRDVAAKLSGATPDGADWNALCPVCRHETFRISKPQRSNYRNIWACACKGCNCGDYLRGALLALDIPAGCLGDYKLNMRPATDPAAAARLREAVDLILSWPGLDPATMRLILGEARGDKVPDEYGAFAKYAQEIGISRAHSFRMAAKACRPAD